MLVAAEVRGELARIQPARPCCRRAELAGLLFRSPSGGLATLDPATARVGMRLTGARPASAPGPRNQAPSGHRHHLTVPLAAPDVSAWNWDAAAACDHRSFLRGVLLGAGSLSFGAGRGHVEFVFSDADRARRLHGWLGELGIRAGRRVRRGRQVVYVKGLDHIAELLQVAGANRALLELAQDRVAGEVQGRLNRSLNAEAANLNRTIHASERQLAAIAALEAARRLDHLPADLRESARLRRRSPEADLASLAEQHGIGRSALNHRLRRLVALAAELEA
jgi:hypothetical protein